MDDELVMYPEEIILKDKVNTEKTILKEVSKEIIKKPKIILRKWYEMIDGNFE